MDKAFQVEVPEGSLQGQLGGVHLAKAVKSDKAGSGPGEGLELFFGSRAV
jgi:hypothetical protein